MLYEGILQEGCHLALELAWRLSGGAGAHLGDAFRTLPVVLFEKPAPPPENTRVSLDPHRVQGLRVTGVPHPSKTIPR